MSCVRVEFYGLARLRAGVAELTVQAATVRAALEAIQVACPQLQVLRGTAVSPEFLVSVDGGRFVTDPDTPLVGGSLLVLGADVGG